MRMYVSEIRSALRKALRWFTVFWSRSKNVILLIVIGLLLNVIPAQLRLEFGVPLYLDCLGTVLTAMLGGYLPSVIVGFGVNAYNGITQEPVAMYYGVLSIFIATTATYMYRRGFFKRIWKLLIVILVLALIGGGLGSIFTYALYGFNFGEGISAPFAIAFHDVMHWDRFTSQFVADIVIDIFDKSAIVLLSALIFRFIPKAYKEKLKDSYFKHNNPYEKKTVRNPLLNKVVMMVIVAEVLLGGLASTIGFLLYRSNSINNFISIAQGVTKAASIAIDAEKVDDYIARGFEVEGYSRVRDVLEDVRESFSQTKFLYVYKILEDGCHVVFDLDTEGEPGGSPGDRIDFDPSFEPYLPNLLAGESMESIVRDEAMFFIKLLSLFFGLSIIIMMIVIELMKRNIVIPVNKMSFATMKIAGETMRATFAFEMGNVNLTRIRDAVEKVKELDIKSNDEIGQLYEYFCDMTRDTYNFIHQVHEQNDRIQRMQEVIIMEFAEMVEARDKSTGDHIKKTAEYVEAIAKELQKEGKFKGVLNDAYVHKLKQAAPLHDIGKIAVSDLILNKNGKLTDEEFAIMKSHTTEGGKILKKMVEDAGDTFDANYLNESIEMASFHHEKWDGSGYPNRLKGEEIPLSARIMAVADVFDALIAERVYKKGFSYEKAMDIITGGAGTHFDPVVVEAFTHISRSLYDARTRLVSETEPPVEKN